MLSNASKYAIRAVLFLAEKSNKHNKFGAAQIADALAIPAHFIAKILQQLAKKQIITSTKGPTGGFYLSQKNLDLKVCDILDEIELKNVFEDCFLGLPACGDDNPCPVHHLVNEFKHKILLKFEHQTISEFSSEIQKEGTHLTLKGII
ncbi:MAG: Rrf2 family transcriptional regulator [Saprospiraceae bacterium]|nr:Rrf2 family transcriptional regulator [Saprospiraceae bacterium]